GREGGIISKLSKSLHFNLIKNSLLIYLITLKFNCKILTLNVYKALLFLGAGSVIHAMADNQDFRKYGGLRAILPLTYSVMMIASLSLVAFPAELFGKLLLREQPSNFGDYLKLLIPSYISEPSN